MHTTTLPLVLLAACNLPEGRPRLTTPRTARRWGVLQTVW